MISLVVLALLGILILLAGIVFIPYGASWPASFVLTPSEIQGLSPSESARLEAWSRDVEALGFRRFGEYRTEVPLGPDDAAPRMIQQLRAWRSADGRERALATHVLVVHSSPQAPSSTALLQLAFESRRLDGSFHATHNCAALDDTMLRPPGWTARVAHGLDRADVLLALHRQGRPRDAVELGVDLPSDVVSVWAWKTGYGLDRGLLRREGDRVRATPRLGLRHAVRMLNPFVQESGSRAATALRLGSLVLLALGAASAVGSPPVPVWTLPALFATAGLLSAVLLPRSALYAFVPALLPTGLWLDRSGHTTGWAWAAGVAAAAFTMSFRQRLEYRATARRIGLPASGPPPLSRMDRIAWGVAFVASAGAAVGAVWAGRRPMPDFSLLPLVLLIFSLGALLLYLVTALLSYHGGLKATPGFRLLRLISLCLALPAFGTVAGVVLQNVDRGNAEAARETIRAALERHREVQGAYPGHLEDLVPAYLPALPRARYGWDNADFVYRGPVAGDEGYRLQSPHDPE